MSDITLSILRKVSAATVASILIGLSGCGGGDGTYGKSTSPQESRPATETVAMNCADCTFGPRQFSRSHGKPQTLSFILLGDPDADYLIEVTDGGSQGANATVILDDQELLVSKDTKTSTPHSILLNSKLKQRSTLHVRLTGRPGSTLSISIVGGAKMVDIDGGTVAIPGGRASVDIPPGALATRQTITMNLAEAASAAGHLDNFLLTLGPEGISFLSPVTLKVKYRPEALAEGVGEDGLALAYLEADGPTQIPSTVDVVNHMVTGHTTHFSQWVLSSARTPTYMGQTGLVTEATWMSRNGCLRRQGIGTTNDFAKLAKAVFKLDDSIDYDTWTEDGCITDPYLVKGYSRDTYEWDTGTFENGAPHIAIGLENHAGVDFRARRPTPAYAIAPGTVVVQSLSPTLGRSTLGIESIINGSTYWIFYLHCGSHMGLTLGDSITLGQQVCVTGSIGAAAPHLHFEVKLKGADIDPSTGRDSERALSGSHCPGYSFMAYNGASGLFDLPRNGCTEARTAQLTVDPSLVVASPTSDPSIDATKGAMGPQCLARLRDVTAKNSPNPMIMFSAAPSSTCKEAGCANSVLQKFTDLGLSAAVNTFSLGNPQGSWPYEPACVWPRSDIFNDIGLGLGVYEAQCVAAFLGAPYHYAPTWCTGDGYPLTATFE